MIVITPPAGGGAPSGAAGGALGGTYPNPAFAVDMATQAELDGAIPGASWLPTGAKVETTSRLDGSLNDRPGPVSGQLWLTPLRQPLKAGVSYSTITFCATDGVTTPTHQWFCLVRVSDMKIRRSTADDTSTAWGSYTRKTLTLSSPYVPVADEQTYVGIVVVAATVGGMLGAGGGVYVPNDWAPKLHGGSTTGLTTPVADDTVAGAVSGEAHTHYAYVS